MSTHNASHNLLIRLQQERDKYSMLTYTLTKALKSILENHNPKEDSAFESLQDIQKYVEEVLKENNLLFK